jgi:hypothetical protein
MASPRKLFQNFVIPSVRDWQANPVDIRRATVAICQIDIVADHFLLHIQPTLTRQSLSAERDALANSERMLGIVRDVHDTHKHGRLARRTAKITRGQVLEKTEIGGPIGSLCIGEGPIGGGGVSKLVVRLDDGSVVLVRNLIQTASQYWELELKRNGL